VGVRPADTAGAALNWLGRGQSFRALAREIAWTAARAAGADQADLDWLSSLVETQLGKRLDELPDVVRERASRAELDHRRTRPHDVEGAEMLGELAAHDAAIEQLSTAYMDVLDWTVGLLRERRAAPSRRLGRWRRRRPEPVDDSPTLCDVPQRILDGLARRSEQPGWRDRRAA
jgi:hypothetical protein